MFRSVAFVVTLSAAGIGLPAMAAAPAQVSSAASTSSVQTPVEVVQSIADQLADALEGHRQEYKNNQDKLIDVINGILLPHFDIDYASILVLGRHARMASPQQRERFAKAFYNSITHRYAEGLLNYTRGSVQVLPRRGPLNERRTIVRTLVKLNGGKNLSVDYAFRKAHDGTWKVYDVIIEGISYITNYRNQVDAEIRNEGLDSLIHRLETQGDEALEQMEKAHGGGH